MDERELIFWGRDTLFSSAKALSESLGLGLVKRDRIGALERLVQGRGGLIVSDDASFAKEHKDLLNRRPYGFLLVDAGAALIEGVIHFETAPLSPSILRHRAKGLLERIWLKDSLSQQSLQDTERGHAWTNEQAVLDHLQTRLNEALCLAEQRATEKTNLLNLLSHEIRTPLNGILSMIHFFESTEMNEEQTGYMAALNRSASTVLELIEGLLDWGQIESGKVGLDCRPFELGALLEEIEMLFRPLAESQGLQLRMEPAGQPVWVEGDVMKLRQVLVNLLGNALKYTDSGWVGLGLEQSKNGWIFAVTDSGKGIDHSLLDNLFEPFWQVEEFGSCDNRGSGLGLAIVQQLTDMMGGKVSASSKLGEGSRFSLELPLSSVKSEPYQSLEQENEVYLWVLERHLCDHRTEDALDVLSRFRDQCQSAGAQDLVRQLDELEAALPHESRAQYQPRLDQLSQSYHSWLVAA